MLSVLSLTPSNTNSFKAAAISSLHLLNSILEGNKYFGPLEIIFLILESEIILNCQ